MENNLFTSPQLRRIQATLLIFEETLRKIGKLLSDGDKSYILYSNKFHINLKKRKQIHNKINQILDYLEVITKKIGLDPVEYSAEKTILGELKINLEYLEECRPKSLRGFGTVNPQAKELINPVIDNLINSTLDIIKIIEV